MGEIGLGMKGGKEEVSVLFELWRETCDLFLVVSEGSELQPVILLSVNTLHSLVHVCSIYSLEVNV